MRLIEATAAASANRGRRQGAHRGLDSALPRREERRGLEAGDSKIADAQG